MQAGVVRDLEVKLSDVENIESEITPRANKLPLWT